MKCYYLIVLIFSMNFVIESIIFGTIEDNKPAPISNELIQKIDNNVDAVTIIKNALCQHEERLRDMTDLIGDGITALNDILNGNDPDDPTKKRWDVIKSKFEAEATPKKQAEILYNDIIDNLDAVKNCLGGAPRGVKFSFVALEKTMDEPTEEATVESLDFEKQDLNWD